MQYTYRKYKNLNTTFYILQFVTLHNVMFNRIGKVNKIKMKLV
jgi:hypothetical protein